MSNREQLIEVFQDTEKWCREDKKLADAVHRAQRDTKVYGEDACPKLSCSKEDLVTEVTVIADRSFQAAIRLKNENPGMRIAVHNFASATNPGGGVTRGSNAQEECLCRCSTLYPVLNTKLLWEQYYNFHRQRRNVRYTDTCIYSPDIMIIKTDTSTPRRLPEAEWCRVDVITCAAPNLREKPNNAMNPGSGVAVRVTDKELLELHKKRARHMLTVAAANGADILVLGAFGCGAFRNKPEIVARAYKEIISEFQGRFVRIEFAVYCPPQDSRNYEVFRRVLG